MALRVAYSRTHPQAIEEELAAGQAVVERRLFPRHEQDFEGQVVAPLRDGDQAGVQRGAAAGCSAVGVRRVELNPGHDGRVVLLDDGLVARGLVGPHGHVRQGGGPGRVRWTGAGAEPGVAARRVRDNVGDPARVGLLVPEQLQPVPGEADRVEVQEAGLELQLGVAGPAVLLTVRLPATVMV